MRTTSVGGGGSMRKQQRDMPPIQSFQQELQQRLDALEKVIDNRTSSLREMYRERANMEEELKDLLQSLKRETKQKNQLEKKVVMLEQSNYKAVSLLKKVAVNFIELADHEKEFYDALSARRSGGENRISFDSDITDDANIDYSIGDDDNSYYNETDDGDYDYHEHSFPSPPTKSRSSFPTPNHSGSRTRQLTHKHNGHDSHMKHSKNPNYRGQHSGHSDAAHLKNDEGKHHRLGSGHQHNAHPVARHSSRNKHYINTHDHYKLQYHDAHHLHQQAIANRSNHKNIHHHDNHYNDDAQNEHHTHDYKQCHIHLEQPQDSRGSLYKGIHHIDTKLSRSHVARRHSIAHHQHQPARVRDHLPRHIEGDYEGKMNEEARDHGLPNSRHPHSQLIRKNNVAHYQHSPTRSYDHKGHHNKINHTKDIADNLHQHAQSNVQRPSQHDNSIKHDKEHINHKVLLGEVHREVGSAVYNDDHQKRQHAAHGDSTLLEDGEGGKICGIHNTKHYDERPLITNISQSLIKENENGIERKREDLNDTQMHLMAVKSKLDCNLKEVSTRLRALKIQNAANVASTAKAAENVNMEVNIDTSLEVVRARIQALKDVNPREAFNPPTPSGIVKNVVSSLYSAVPKIIGNNLESEVKKEKNGANDENDSGSRANTEVMDI